MGCGLGLAGGGGAGLLTLARTPVTPGSVLPMPPPLLSAAPLGPEVTVTSVPLCWVVKPAFCSAVFIALAMSCELEPGGTSIGIVPWPPTTTPSEPLPVVVWPALTPKVRVWP